MRVNQLIFHMRAPACMKEEGEWIIASCPPLDVHSQGSTEEEALANLSEALRFFIESCVRRGTLDQVLKNAGFELEHDGTQDEDHDHIVDVPISLLAAKHAQACTG